MKNPGITNQKFEKLLKRMEFLDIREQDLEEKFTCSTGPGGQNVNKLATCVQLKHTPSGIEIKAQQARTQAMNRYYARKKLCEILEEKKLGKKSPAQRKIDKIRKQKQKRKSRARQKTQIKPLRESQDSEG